MILGIDAINIESGGGKRHLNELLNYQIKNKPFNKIIIWSSLKTLTTFQDSPYIEKRSHKFLNRGYFFRILWQIFISKHEFTKSIDILFSPSGTYIGKFHPYISMSQNMLIFQKNEQKNFKLSFYRLKFYILNIIQKKSFKNSNGIIFISDYAYHYISNLFSILNKKIVVINHGINFNFFIKPKKQFEIDHYNLNNPFKLLYVSPFYNYKHQLEVIEAFLNLRKVGYNITLDLVGNFMQKSQERKIHNFLKYNNLDSSIFIHKEVKLNEIQKFYHNTNAFIFASSCENMPNILIEAMASGLPIACSNLKPMTDFLGGNAFYFNPYQPNSIFLAIENMLNNHNLRNEYSYNVYNIAKQYTWDQCAYETYKFLLNTK